MSLTMQVGGRELLLRWTVPAWLELEKQVGNIKTMWGDISTGKMPMSNQLRLAVAMANAGAKYRGEKGGVTLEWLAENLTHAQAIEIGRLAVRGYEIAMHREHAEDDDEEVMVDAVLEEEQKKTPEALQPESASPMD